MNGGVILAIVLVVVLLIAAAALAVRGNGAGRGQGNLRRRFGPEYDRLAAERGDLKAAEQELAGRVREHEALELRPLEPEERERYEHTWSTVQERFIDDPRGAVRQADQVIGGLLTAMGYPSADRERQLDLASVDHAGTLVDYRDAREAAADESSDTETLRQALLKDRAMFHDLIGGREPARAAH